MSVSRMAFGVARPSGLGPILQSAGVLAALRVPVTDQLLRLLRERPGTTQIELANWIGVSRSTISRSLSRLASDGLVGSTAAGRRLEYRLTLAVVAPPPPPRSPPVVLPRPSPSPFGPAGVASAFRR